MTRGRLFGFALAALAACSAVGACSDFGDEPAPSPDAAAPEAAAIDGAGDDASGPDGQVDAGPCVPGTPFATPGGPAPAVVTCDGVSGIDLLRSAAHCGRCNRACGLGTLCVDGECGLHMERPFDADATVSEGAHILARIGDLTFFAEGWYRLVARKDDGAYAIVSDLFGTGDGNTPFTFGGVGGDPSRTYVRHRTRLFRFSSGGLVSVVPLADNDKPTGVAVVPGSVYVSSKSSLQRYDEGARMVVDLPAPSSHYLTAARGAAYWLELPWNPELGTVTPGAGSTLRKADAGSSIVVHQSNAQLIELRAFTDALYFMRLGAGGGIFRLPYDAKPTTVPERIAQDELLSTRHSGFAEDANDVYWLRPSTSADPNLYAELWKQSKCGGAGARIASKLLIADGIAVAGDRVFVGTNQGLVSIAK